MRAIPTNKLTSLPRKWLLAGLIAFVVIGGAFWISLEPTARESKAFVRANAQSWLVPEQLTPTQLERIRTLSDGAQPNLGTIQSIRFRKWFVQRAGKNLATGAAGAATAQGTVILNTASTDYIAHVEIIRPPQSTAWQLQQFQIRDIRNH